MLSTSSRVIQRRKARKLGILGGMGPLASAEFLRTIYELNITAPEQDAPSCVLLSEPSFPDRTQAILNGDCDEILARLSRSLEELSLCGADPIVIACVTIHHVLPRLPEALRKKVISLIDLVVDEVLATPQRYLLLTTTGTRAAGVFEQHERWPEIAPWIVRPDDEEQRGLHDQIYLLKREEPGEGSLAWLEGLASRHAVAGIIFGCTELHLLHRLLARHSGQGFDRHIIDPLLTTARNLRVLLYNLR
jgi:aspartate racemase